jgi:hypothetical protein
MINFKINLDSTDQFYLLVNGFLKNENNYFNSIKYFKTQSKSKEDLYFQLVRKKNNYPIASISFILKNKIFLSPLKGTFGGPDFVENSIRYEIIEEFIVKVLNILNKKKYEEIQIKLPPYAHNIDLVSTYINIFLNNGFKIFNHEINFQILVDDVTYEKKISATKKKTLSKCIKKNFSFKELHKINLTSVYSVIKENRDRKSYKISMSCSELKKLITIFEDKFKLFGVFYNTELIASCICISISKKILYVFYWAEKKKYLEDSPIVFMSLKLYKYCYDNNYKILDVGTASVNGLPNYGLLNYKKSLGYFSCNKLSIKKKFNERFI